MPDNLHYLSCNSNGSEPLWCRIGGIYATALWSKHFHWSKHPLIFRDVWIEYRQERAEDRRISGRQGGVCVTLQLFIRTCEINRQFSSTYGYGALNPDGFTGVHS